MISLVVGWFSRKRGRAFTKVLAMTCITGGGLSYLLPNSIFVELFQEITEFHTPVSREKAELSDSTKDLIHQVQSDMKVTEEEMKKMSFYFSSGFDFYTFGSMHTSYGSAISIPIYFDLSPKSQFYQTGMQVLRMPINWKSPCGSKLYSSFALSDAAKKFILARQIHNTRTYQNFVNVVCTSTIITMTYAMARLGNIRLNLFKRRIGARMVWYSLLAVFNYGLYSLVHDVTNCHFETEADKTAAEISEDYARGGVEFYKQALERNIALRGLMGSSGEKIYTITGNVQSLIRTTNVPLVFRRDNLQAIVDTYSASKGDTVLSSSNSRPVVPPSSSEKSVVLSSNSPTSVL